MAKAQEKNEDQLELDIQIEEDKPEKEEVKEVTTEQTQTQEPSEEQTSEEQEAKEDGVVCIFASNSTVSNAIKRCRSGIKFVDVHTVGATLYFDAKSIRPFHTVLKINKKIEG